MSEFRLKILTPTTGVCKAAYTFSLANLVMYYMQNRIYPDCDRQWLGVKPIAGSGISANRERLVAEALETDATHILFIDEDMGFHPNALHVLAEKRLPLVGCNYRMKKKEKEFVALSADKKKRIVTDEKSKGIEECYYTGFGFCLIKREVFEKVARPWFLIGYNTEQNAYTTEDCGFARQLKDNDITWYVDHDASKLVWHVGDYDYKWNE
jgi:hypothetical protein